ncbi:MAG: DUF6807 family protein [Puniceicoccaceae bacterium]
MTDAPSFNLKEDGSLWFQFDGLVAGAYQLKDSHKPYLHPVYTPKGFKLSLDRPHDHPHHKALMFALRTDTHNYWEEYPVNEGDIVGRQCPQGEPELVAEGNTLICRHTLVWKGEGEADAQMVEERTISCTYDDSAKVFEWKWKSCLTPKVDLQLDMSPYIPEPEEGTRVNYDGLGIRLRREFGCTGGNQVTVDGEVLPLAEASGKLAKSVTYQGSIDEIWPVPKCTITFSSPEPMGVFVIDFPFAYLSFGPTVLEKPLWKADEEKVIEYSIQVADVPATD